MKQLVKKVYRITSRVSRLFLLKILMVIGKHLRSELIIVYDSQNTSDGFGAQLHRIVSLMHTATLLGFSIRKPKISSITIHPLDPIRSIDEMGHFLEISNQRLFGSFQYFDEMINTQNSKLVEISSLNLKTCLRFMILSKIYRKSYVLFVKEAHAIADLAVDSYQNTIQIYFAEFIGEFRKAKKPDAITVHYRQGVGGFAIYPGQKIPRQLPLEHFKMAILSLSNSDLKDIRKLRIFTDSPRSSVEFIPPRNQLSLWEGTPGFDGKKVTYSGSDVDAFFGKLSESLNLELEVIRSADPLQMIIEMALTPILITSRSSLSYIGGLFNHSGIVYSAPDFWHFKPSKWV